MFLLLFFLSLEIDVFCLLFAVILRFFRIGGIETVISWILWVISLVLFVQLETFSS